MLGESSDFLLLLQWGCIDIIVFPCQLSWGLPHREGPLRSNLKPKQWHTLEKELMNCAELGAVVCNWKTQMKKVHSSEH